MTDIVVTVHPDSEIVSLLRPGDRGGIRQRSAGGLALEFGAMFTLEVGAGVAADLLVAKLGPRLAAFAGAQSKPETIDVYFNEHGGVRRLIAEGVTSTGHVIEVVNAELERQRAAGDPGPSENL